MAYKKGNVPWHTGTKKQFCPKGHDTLIVGRQLKARGCNQCKKDLQVKNGRWREHGILNQDGTLFMKVDFDRHYQLQSGECKGCKKHSTELDRPLFVDHDHETLIFRALLCSKCNSILGYVDDKIEILKNLIEVLKESR